MTGHTPEQVERGYDALSSWSRVLGVCRLLARSDVDGFTAGLRASGEARRDLLALRVRSGQPFGYYTAAGRYGPLCDAVAAGADELAREIVRRSADALQRGEELAEDFAYARALHALVLPGPGRAEAIAGLAAALGDDPRVDVVRALDARDQDAFEAALEALAEAWADDLDETPRLSRGETFQADRGIFVEGLALLRLGAARGLRFAPEPRFLPPLARIPEGSRRGSRSPASTPTVDRGKAPPARSRRPTRTRSRSAAKKTGKSARTRRS